MEATLRRGVISGMDRVIFHCDLNCFYASVELLSHPELREVPVAVCGDPDARHGIVLAKNMPAKRMGVTTGEAIWQARQKCPELKVVPPNFPKYVRFAKMMREIYAEYTDMMMGYRLNAKKPMIQGSANKIPAAV